MMYGPTQRGKSSKSKCFNHYRLRRKCISTSVHQRTSGRGGYGVKKKRRKNLRRKKDSKFDKESARLPLLQPLITHLVCGSNQSVAYPRRRICTAQSSVKFHCLWHDHTCSLSPTISRAITTSGKFNLQSYLSPDRSTVHHSHLIFQMCIPLWIKSRFQIQSSFHSS